MAECPFTGVEARQVSGTELGIKTFESDGCGSFSIHNSALDAITGDLNLSPQARVNCGRRCFGLKLRIVCGPESRIPLSWA